MLDFSEVKAFGLTQSELAKVLDVSRVTINLWANGKMKPHRLHAEAITGKIKALRLAVELGLIPKAVRGKPRHDAIMLAIKQVEDGPISV